MYSVFLDYCNSRILPKIANKLAKSARHKYIHQVAPQIQASSKVLSIQLFARELVYANK